MRGSLSLSLLATFASLSLGALGGCNCGLEPLAAQHPHMKVSPTSVVLDDVPVAQDRKIVFRIKNDALGVPLGDVRAELRDADPAFRLGDVPVEVLAGTSEELTVKVRPLLANQIKAKLVIDAQDDAVPNHVEIPIVINAINAGLPDICVDPEEVVFDRTGRNSVSRADVNIQNCGVRDLVFDKVFLTAVPGADVCNPDYVEPADADTTIKLVTTVPPGTSAHPNNVVTVSLAFAPLDVLQHTAELVICSNDPDDNPFRVPVSGEGAECPIAVAELVDGPDDIEPFDTVRLDGSNSTAVAPGDYLTYEWSMAFQPVGSLTGPEPFDQPRAELPVNVAGHYTVLLNVTDNHGVRNCQPAVVDLDVIPSEELLVQLVWDHEDADLDLHLLREGGTVFTHEGDCYFSNRHPDWFADEPDSNPELDHDDSRGYGPENLNIKAPSAGSHWQVLVHYWNKQTDGDPRTTATLRIFVFGQQVLELERTFEDDQVLWEAVDIDWPLDDTTEPALSQIGTVEPFLRPF